MEIPSTEKSTMIYSWWNNLFKKFSDNIDVNDSELPKKPPFGISFKIIQDISPLLTLFFKDLQENQYSFLDDIESSSQDSDISDDSDNLDIEDKKSPKIDYSVDIESINPMFTETSRLNDQLWEGIYTILKQLNNDNNIPHPNVNFPGFIEHLFMSKEKLNPLRCYRIENRYTIEMCILNIIKIISLNSKIFHPEIFLWDLPSALDDDEVIYFMVLFELQSSYHPIWKKFSSTFGAMNLFFDHYLPLLGPSNDTTTLILIRICDLIFHQEQSYFNITKPKKQAKILYLKYMRLIGCSTNPEIITAAFLAAKSLYLQMVPDLPSSFRTDWLNMLIDASSNGVRNGYLDFYKIGQNPKQDKQLLSNDYRINPVHYFALDFLFSLKVPKFKYMTLCKTLVHQGITQVHDLYYIHQCLMQNIKKPLYGIKFLLTTASSNKIFSTTATKLLIEPLIRFSNLDTVRQTVSLFVRKGFVFIGVTLLNNKYFRRRLMVLQMFRTLYMEASIDWLSEVIIKYYSSLVNSNRMTNLIPDIPLTYKNDKKLKKVTSKMDLYHNGKNKGNKPSFPSIESTRSVNDFNQAIKETNDENDAPEKPYDKMFIAELDRISKIQTNMKTYLNASNLDSVAPKNPVAIRTTNSQYHTKKPMNQPVINARQQRIQQMREKYMQQHKENLEKYRNFHGMKRPPFDTSQSKQIDKQPMKPAMQLDQQKAKMKKPTVMVMKPSPRQLSYKRKPNSQNKQYEIDTNEHEISENDLDELILNSMPQEKSFEDQSIPESASIDFQQFNTGDIEEDDVDEEEDNDQIVNTDVEIIENDDDDNVDIDDLLIRNDDNDNEDKFVNNEDEIVKEKSKHFQPREPVNVIHDVKRSPPAKNLVVPRLKQFPGVGAKSACRPLYQGHTKNPPQSKKNNVLYKPVKLK